MGRGYQGPLKHQCRLKEAVVLIHSEVARNASRRDSPPELEGAHTQRSRTDGQAVGLQDPALAWSEGIMQEMPRVLFFEVAGVGQVPAPQVDDDLPVFLEIGGSNSIFNQFQ
jgi:hypothetical protein